MAPIRSLKPNVSQDEALRTFTAGFSTFYWRFRTGPLQCVADVYVPFWLFQARYFLGRAKHTRLFAMDAVDGSLDLFEFPRPPDEAQLLAISTRNCPQPALSDSQAIELCREKVLRIIFQQGFFKLRDTGLEIHREPGEFYLPYWLGLYGQKEFLRCRVLDAVRRRLEGAKASAFFEHWLARPGGLAA